MSSIPLVEPLPPSLTAERAFRNLPKGRGLFYLDGAAPAGGLGRWSILGFDPYAVIDAGRPAGAPPDPLARLTRAIRHPGRRRTDIPGPFGGGAVGFFSYDLGRRFERIPEIARDDLGLPDLWFGLYDLFAVFDNRSGRGWIVSTGDPESGVAAAARAEARLETMRGALHDRDALEWFRCGASRSPHTCESYSAEVERCLEWIAAGDVYQVNLSHRFDATFEGSPPALYLELRRANPAPFAAYIDTGDRQILSSSPERFLRIDAESIESRPIKGTRPRGGDRASDRRLAEELLGSAKDHAELTMIVDLLRNDLGKVCAYGTVETEALARLESFETVHHLVGVIRGRLRSGVGVAGAIRACFPGGSITGAPKIRAMEILEQIEPTRRGIYCGSIGYIGFDGRSDLNIAIRTLLVQNGRVHVQVGGGIVADSIPRAEYEETLHKAKGIFRAMRAGPARTSRPAAATLQERTR